ncbi:hypothetical protein [Actinomadura sp. KC216]|nr:hypothetical protein [Actinomadura sp. KC216]
MMAEYGRPAGGAAGMRRVVPFHAGSSIALVALASRGPGMRMNSESVI